MVRTLVAGFGSACAAMALSIGGAAAATAEELVPDPSTAGNGREADGAVRESATQGEVRSAGMGEAMAPAGGEVRSGAGRAIPSTRAWVFPGAAGDISACVIDGPYCANWLAIPFDLNNP